MTRACGFPFVPQLVGIAKAFGFHFDSNLANNKPVHRWVDRDRRSAACAPDCRRGRRCCGPLAYDGLTLLRQSFTFGGAVSHFALQGPRRGAFPLHG